MENVVRLCKLYSGIFTVEMSEAVDSNGKLLYIELYRTSNLEEAKKVAAKATEYAYQKAYYSNEVESVIGIFKRGQ